MAKKKAARWAKGPAPHDFPSAESYLRLLGRADLVEVLTGLLSQAPTVFQDAKDILRASRLPLLEADDLEVAKDLKKITNGERLDPVLLIRGDLTTGRAMQIADGYHRVCASYHVTDNAEVACRIVDIPSVVLS